MHREPRCMARSCLLALLATVRGAYFVLEQPFSSTARFFPALTHSVTHINKLVMPCHNRLFLSGSHLMQYLNFIEYRTPAYIYIYTKLDGQLGTLFIEAVSGMGHHAGTLNFFQLIISNSKPSIFRRPGLGRLRRKLSKRRARLLSSKGMVQRSINKRTGKRSVSGT